jgi:hypothetical protein
MARSDLQRYTETYAYLNNLSSALATAVDQAVRENDLKKGELGHKVSLKGIWSKGHLYRGQHVALRALLLCQAVFLSPPWARKAAYKRVSDGNGGFAGQRDGYEPYYTSGQLDVPTSAVRNMSESDIKKRILCYVPRLNATLEDLALAAEAPNVEGGIDHSMLTREAPLALKNPICFDAVSLWLFKSGFVSIRWLTREGPSLQADTANDMLGLGTVITPEELERMPRGYLFNFHAADSGGRVNRDVCHWGISLGNGRGAAANTTPQEQTTDGRTVRVRFEGAGSSRYGLFPMRDSYEVCRLKYGKERKTDTVIRQIDPTAVGTYY